MELARGAASGRAAVWASVGPGPAQAVQELVAEVDADALAEAVRAARSVWSGALVASVVPGPSAVDLSPLLLAGADGAGFNCGRGPGDVLAAVRRAGIDPLWARPAGGAFDDTVAALDELAGRCRWVGGCCGVSPAMIAAARRRRG